MRLVVMFWILKASAPYLLHEKSTENVSYYELYKRQKVMQVWNNTRLSK